jgi:hypothetical protein
MYIRACKDRTSSLTVGRVQIALGDVAQLCAHVLVSQGPHGLSDEVRGQMMVATGPMMTAGPELAEAASQALSVKMEFQSISEYVMFMFTTLASRVDDRLILGRRPRRFSHLSKARRSMTPRRSTYSNITRSSARARRTTPRLLHSRLSSVIADRR